MAALTKRLTLKIPENLDAWITENADREGLDNASWVRWLLTRTMNGHLPRPRPGLEYSMVEPEMVPGLCVAPLADEADVLLRERVEGAVETAAPAAFVEAPPAAEDLSHERAVAAVPLRRIERSRYNPGRTGYG